MTTPHHTLYPISVWDRVKATEHRWLTSKSIIVAVVLVWFTASHMWRPQLFSAFVQTDLSSFQTDLPFFGSAVELKERSQAFVLTKLLSSRLQANPASK
jgi:hypothetical protein